MKQILVTGCRGQLGNELQLLAPQYADTCRFHFTDREELDITDRRAVFDFIESHSIAIVINCAAYTAVDRAEEDEALCDLLNHIAPGYLAEAVAVPRECGNHFAAHIAVIRHTTVFPAYQIGTVINIYPLRYLVQRRAHCVIAIPFLLQFHGDPPLSVSRPQAYAHYCAGIIVLAYHASPTQLLSDSGTQPCIIAVPPQLKLQHMP